MEDTLARPRNDATLVNDSDDDTPMLSSHALAALKEFLEERDNGISEEAEQREPEDDKEEVSLVSEDWRLSQFWYDAVTAETVAKEAVTISAAAGASSPVACVACPTLYPYIKKLDPSVGVQLLEFDRRFEQFGSDFTFYDYNLPEELPEQLKHAFRVVIADPPYLSKECLEKVSQTIAFLASPGQAYILLLTGEVQRDRAAELLGLYPCGFRPQHSSKLGNEFRLFTNYDPGMRLGGWKLD